MISDRYPLETSYTLKNTCTGAMVAEKPRGSFVRSTSHKDTYCVTTQAAFEFTIRDSYGDGLCCQWGEGSYSVTFEGTTYTGGSFEKIETKEFGNCAELI